MGVESQAWPHHYRLATSSRSSSCRALAFIFFRHHIILLRLAGMAFLWLRLWLQPINRPTARFNHKFIPGLQNSEPTAGFVVGLGWDSWVWAPCFHYWNQILRSSSFFVVVFVGLKSNWMSRTKFKIYKCFRIIVIIITFSISSVSTDPAWRSYWESLTLDNYWFE